MDPNFAMMTPESRKALDAVTLPKTPALPVLEPASTKTTTMIMPKPMNSSIAAIGAVLRTPPKPPAIRLMFAVSASDSISLMSSHALL